MIRRAFLFLFLLSACASPTTDAKPDDEPTKKKSASDDDGGDAADTVEDEPSARAGGGRGKRRGQKGKRKRKRRGGGDGDEGADDGATYRVPVRFHVLQSAVAPVVNATLDEAGAKALLADANAAWKQADIQFELESVEKVEARPAEAKAYQAFAEEWEAAKRNKPKRSELKPRRGKLMWATVPKAGSQPAKGVDIYIHHHMLGLGGVWQCPRRAVIYGQFNPGKQDQPASGAVFAHEIGHGLGLGHVPCKVGGNLMMEPCKHRKPDATGLEPDQIATARAIAKTGAVKQCKRGEASLPED